ncbi:hypothetical protein JTB14_013009 [Gonioctena quinquepunctata]|nr:hypothetical protein JTB14_013009 [Gonioctena quinquepunctata]
MILIIIFNFFKQNKWKYILRNISEITKNEDITYAIPKRKNGYLLWKVAIGHLLFVCVKVIITYYETPYKFFSPAHSLNRIVQRYYCFLSAMIASCLAYIIMNKYEDLSKILKMYIKVSIDDVMLTTKIINVERRFRRLYELVKCYNDIFGWIIILTFLNAIIEFLRWVNLILHMFKHHDISIGTSVSVVCCTSLCFVSTTW